MGSLERSEGYEQVTIKSGENLSEAFCMGDYAMLLIDMPTSWTAADIGFKHSVTKDGTYKPLYDKDNLLVQIDSATAGQAHAAPPEIAAALWLKLWSQNGSGEDVNQTDTRSLYIVFKS